MFSHDIENAMNGQNLCEMPKNEDELRISPKFLGGTKKVEVARILHRSHEEFLAQLGRVSKWKGSCSRADAEGGRESAKEPASGTLMAAFRDCARL